MFHTSPSATKSYRMPRMQFVAPFIFLICVILFTLWRQHVYITHAKNNEPILVLVPLALESALGADAYRKIEFALEDANGKAGERSVELLTVDLSYLDDAGKLEDDERIGSLVRTISDERVVGVIGPITTDASILATPLLNAAGLAQISYTTTYPGFTVPDFAGNPSHSKLFPTGAQTFFTLVPHTVDMARAVSAYLLESGTSTIFTIHDGTTYSETATAFLSDAFTEYGGTIIATGTLATSAGTDVEALADAVVASKTPIVFIISYPHEGYYAFMEALAARKYPGYIMGYAMQRANVVEQTPLRNRVLSLNYTPSLAWMNTPITNSFLARYKLRYPDHPEDLQSIFTPYDAMNIMLTAIRESDGTRQGVLSALQALRRSPTLYGNILFDKNGYRTENILEISELVDGVFTFKTYIHP